MSIRLEERLGEWPNPRVTKADFLSRTGPPRFWMVGLLGDWRVA